MIYHFKINDMDNLNVKTKKETIEKTITCVVFSYEFKDREGFMVKGENIGSEKDLLSEIKSKTKNLKNYNVIVEPIKN